MDNPIRQDALNFKGTYLYDKEYKECIKNTQLYIFDEPMKCTSADYTMYILDILTKSEGKTTLSIPDGIHPYRTLVFNTGLSISTLENSKGQMFNIQIQIPHEALSHKEALSLAKELSQTVGLPEHHSKNEHINYIWITPDNFDISLKEVKGGHLLDITARDGYEELNTFLTIKSRE